MTPIGIFDSGYGGLTVLKQIRTILPEYDFVYLGDNARAPYGDRSFETVYRFTKQSVKWLLDYGCPLVILACNTASAKALRNIQQMDLPVWSGENRVLGVIRPTIEEIGGYTQTGKIGILATTGTVRSESYLLEMAKAFPGVTVYQQACPLWVPLIEAGDYLSAGSEEIFQKDISALIERNHEIDCILLGCTHYPVIGGVLRKFIPPEVKLISQGAIVAAKLRDYLFRHREIDNQITKEGKIRLFTTGNPEDFNLHSEQFFGEAVAAEHVDI